MSLLGSLPNIIPQGSSGGLSGLLVYNTTFTIMMGTSKSSLVNVTALFPPMEQISMHYDDPISFQADTLEIIFPDINDTIIKNPKVKKGIWMSIVINQFNRDYPGSHTQRKLGTFMIDQIKQIGPPSQTTLMASALPIDSQAKMTLQNKTRYVTTLKELTQAVATENGLTLTWDVSANSYQSYKVYSQTQQWNESDLSMLSRYLKQNALSMKITDGGNLIVFDEQAYELKPAVYTIDFAKPGAGIGMVRWELTTQSQDIYSQSQLAWYDPTTGTVTVGVAKATSETGTKEHLNVVHDPGLQPSSPGEVMSRGD